MVNVKQGSFQEAPKIEVRCLECLIRIQVSPDAKEIKCPQCGIKYFIYWPAPDIAKIKGVAP